MMRHWLGMASALAMIAGANSASAAIITVEGGGVLTSATNATTIGPGNAVAFSFSFDTDSLVFATAPNADTNIYNFTPLSFSATVGSYQLTPDLTVGSLVIGRGFSFLGSPSGTERVVNQTFALGGLGGADAPFNLPGGVARVFINFTSTFRAATPTPAIDLSALADPAGAARSNFSLTGVPPTGNARGFASGPANGSFANVAAVPEPSTWLMLILGFGALGRMLRRRSAWTSRAARA